MHSRTSTFLTALIGGGVCGWFIFHGFFGHARTVRNDVVQGILIGWELAFVTAQMFARVRATKINGWITMLGCGLPGNGMLLRAAHAQVFPGPVNVPQEAMYWTTSGDGAGHALIGQHDYIMHFAPGGLPPNSAFWSLTMGDAKNRFVPNPINRYSVSDHRGLAQKRDGSVGRGVVLVHLFLAAHAFVRVQESDSRARGRQRTHSSQYAPGCAPNTFCGSPPPARLGLEIGDDGREP
jgi:hypothetical protein